MELFSEEDRDGTVSAEHAAILLGISARTVRRAVRSGTIDASSPGRNIRLSHDEIDRLRYIRTANDELASVPHAAPIRPQKPFRLPLAPDLTQPELDAIAAVAGRASACGQVVIRCPLPEPAEDRFERIRAAVDLAFGVHAQAKFQGEAWLAWIETVADASGVHAMAFTLQAAVNAMRGHRLDDSSALTPAVRTEISVLRRRRELFPILEMLLRDFEAAVSAFHAAADTIEPHVLRSILKHGDFGSGRSTD